MLPDFQCKTSGQETVSGELLYQLGTAFDIRVHEQVQAAEHGTKRENRDSDCELRPDGFFCQAGVFMDATLEPKNGGFATYWRDPTGPSLTFILPLPLYTDPDAVPAVVAAST